MKVFLQIDNESVLGPQVVRVSEPTYTPPDSNTILLVDTTVQPVEIHLLQAVQTLARQHLVKLVAGPGPITFDALSDVVLSKLNESFTVLFDGQSWIVIAQYP